MEDEDSDRLRGTLREILRRGTNPASGPLCACVAAGEFCETLEVVRIASDALVSLGLRKAVELRALNSEELHALKVPNVNRFLQEKVYIPPDPRTAGGVDLDEYIKTHISPVFRRVAENERIVRVAFRNQLGRLPQEMVTRYYNTVVQGMVLFHRLCDRDERRFDAFLEEAKGRPVTRSGMNDNGASRSRPRAEAEQNDRDWERMYAALQEYGSKLQDAVRLAPDGGSGEVDYFCGLGEELYRRVNVPLAALSKAEVAVERAVRVSEYMTQVLGVLLGLTEEKGTRTLEAIQPHFEDWQELRGSAYFRVEVLKGV